jgi:serine/threonine protein kinase
MYPGKRLQHYVLLEQIGQGGQAAVWSAEDELLKRTVAIKTINIRQNADGSPAATVNLNMGGLEEQSQRFVTEARTIADLEHPYILPVYTYGQDGDWLYIVMRYMAGGTLRTLITSDGLPLAQAMPLLTPLADALDQAHQRQIIHRDIKSVNVLLDSQRRPYLADFGLSVTAGDSSSQSGSGTLAYMSPEQLRGDMADHRSDLYAFGILIYEMLTGDTPRWNTGHWNMVQLTNNAPLPDADQKLSDGVLAILRRATARDPMERYPSATALVDALRETIKKEARITGELLTLDASPFQSGFDSGDGFLIELLPINDPALIALNKANELYTNALNEWADGAGRFRLYADDYKFIDSFYGSAENTELALNDAGKRLMLRAALEHDYKIDHWWRALERTSERRAVALQTLSSELPSARLRAIETLTLLEDSNPPAIPIRVATIISRESDTAVREAGIVLLEERAKRSDSWRDYAYNSVIDDVLTMLATTDADPHVHELAARTIGRLRAGIPATDIARRAADADSDPRNIQALTYIREEAPTLPTSVPTAVRRRVVARLTLRQLFAQPVKLFTRYLWIVFGAALGIGVFAYSVILAQGAQQLGEGGLQATFGLSGVLSSVLNIGLTYGLFFALAVFLAIEPARRLKVWAKPYRALFGLVAGGVASYLAFMAYRSLSIGVSEPLDAPLYYIPSTILFIAGFALSSAFTARTWARTLSGFAGIMAGLLFNWWAHVGGLTEDYLFYLDAGRVFTARAVFDAALVGGFIGVFAFAPEWATVVRKVAARIRI